MELFFGRPSSDNVIILDEDESNHILNVKRSTKGDVIHVTDGEGNLFTTEIAAIEKRTCTLTILDVKATPKKSTQLHIAIAPTKSIDRIEWFLEKATESGIDEVTFLLCRHSERKEIKIDRLNRLIVSSIKQSNKTWMPRLNPMTGFGNFVSEKHAGRKLIFSTSAEESESMKKNCKPGESLIALIGPEGDFHTDEVTLALKNGYFPASLGSSRLRTETAALTACVVFNFINGK